MRVGIIGSGFGLYGLLPAFNSLDNCDVVALCAKPSERVLTYAASVGLTKLYTNWEEMLEKESLDAVAIAVIPSVQYTIAKRAIEKGLHVFAEKPLTATYEEAKELFSLAQEKGVTTMVDFIFPEIDEWQKVKELLDTKVYGELKHLSVAWDFLSYDIKHGLASWKTDVKEGGGALAFYGSHTLYYVEYFGGRIRDSKGSFTYSDVSKNGAEVGIDLSCVFAGGASCDIHISCNTPNKNTHVLTFVCEKATLVLESHEGVTEHFSLTEMTEVGSRMILVKNNNNKKNEEDERVSVVANLAERFITGCMSSSQVTPSFKEGLRVQELIEEIRGSIV